MVIEDGCPLIFGPQFEELGYVEHGGAGNDGDLGASGVRDENPKVYGKWGLDRVGGGVVLCGGILLHVQRASLDFQHPALRFIPIL